MWCLLITLVPAVIIVSSMTHALTLSCYSRATPTQALTQRFLIQTDDEYLVKLFTTPGPANISKNWEGASGV